MTAIGDAMEGALERQPPDFELWFTGGKPIRPAHLAGLHHT
jgi:hypothetical protein